ncbi:GNAT family N-acetyltransferase [Glycomyces salinus]|uniref:GNAT family N-acetyltransferase n=1 Tax=Glycomyces salinus TaxID=980294 RepID=UPI0018EA5A92|nr:GNAT family N-acetyltransferase [Glycomyces salinus]
MNIIELDPAETRLVSGAFEVLRAAHKADAPETPPPHEGVFSKSLHHPEPTEDEHHYVALDGDRVAGWLSAFFPNRENLHFCGADIVVHPERRREGIGSALLERFLDLARAEGRTEVTIETRLNWEGGPDRSEVGRRFLENRGFKLALTCVIRRTDVDALAEADERALLDQATRAAGEDYEIISWIGHTPDELMETMSRLDSMILSEVPLGDLELEPEKVDPELKRAKADRADAIGIVPVATIARHRESGEAVANTAIGVFDDREFEHSFQWITIVDPAHRGHRLGTLVKLVNLRLLREQFPQVRQIWTDNADVNAHMIDINRKMGFETLDAVGEFKKNLDA